MLSHAELFATIWTIACQFPLSMGFSRQEYWSGLPFPPPGDLPMSFESPALQADILQLSHWVSSYIWASLVAQIVKNLPAIQEIRVQSLSQEAPMEIEMATRSSILAWRIPWTEEPAGYSPWGLKESDTTERLTLAHFFTFIYIYIYICILNWCFLCCLL